MKRNYIYAALLYAFTMAVTPAIAGQPQQDLGVAKAQLAPADHTAHILGQGQQAQAVGHGAAALAQLFRGRFLR